MHSEATILTGSPAAAAAIAVGMVVPVMSRLPASRAVFWSPGLVNGMTSTVPPSGTKSS